MPFSLNRHGQRMFSAKKCFLAACALVFLTASTNAQAATRVVSFAPGTSSAEVKQTLSDAGVSTAQVQHLPETDLYRIVVAQREVPQLAADPDVSRIDAQHTFSIAPTVAEPPELTSNASYLWHLRNTGQDGGLAGADIGAPAAWAGGAQGKGVIVATVDSGADITHVDLASQVWTNKHEIPSNNIDDDRNGYVDDVHGANILGKNGDLSDGVGHGTGVAGFILAAANSTGVVGVAPDAQLMTVRSLDNDGSGSDFDVATGIIYAVANGAQVINLSLGGSAESNVIKVALQFARARNVMIIVASGNEGKDNDVTPVFPANDSPSFTNMLSVGSTDHSDQPSTFSDYGAHSVDLFAPGEDVVTDAPNGLYQIGSGTSFAAPMVTGAAAILRGQAPYLNTAGMKKALRAGVTVLPQLQAKVITSGRLSIPAALAALPADRKPPRSVTKVKLKAKNKKVTLAWKGNRDASRYRVVLDETVSKTTRRMKTTFKVKKGKHYFRIIAVDTSGNESTARNAFIRVR